MLMRYQKTSNIKKGQRLDGTSEFSDPSKQLLYRRQHRRISQEQNTAEAQQEDSMRALKPIGINNRVAMEGAS